MATVSPRSNSRAQTLIKIRESEFQTLLTEKKPLKNWSCSEVIIWLKVVNDGLFAKYKDLFESKQIDGKTLMTLDDEKQVIELIGTQHHSIVFVQCIKQLKAKTGRRRLSRKQKSQSLATLSFDKNQIFDLPDLVNIARSSTPTHYRSRSNRFRQSPSVSGKPSNYSLPQYSLSHNRKRSLSQDDMESIAKDPKDKKNLWRIYKTKQTYSDILFKRGKYNTAFKKRWLVLCEKKKKNSKSVQRPMLGRPMSNSVYKTNEKQFGYESGNMYKRLSIGYLFYFNERPIKDTDFPNGFVDLSSVECVVGLLDVDVDVDDDNKECDESNHTDVKYLKNKAIKSEYYEIVLKTKDREWIFGAIDTSSYIEWLIRLKKYEA